MTATLPDPRPAAAPPSAHRRARLARAERPLLLAGLALIALHLLDLAFSGPATSLPGVLAIVTVPLAWAAAQPHVTRPTRLALGAAVGLLVFGIGVVSHGLHVVNSGPDWRDLTGVGMIAGGLLLVASGVCAACAPRRAPRRPAPAWRLAHGVAWLAAVPVVAVFGLSTLYTALLTTHAPRLAIQEASLPIPHAEVVVETGDGRDLSAWYVPSENRSAVLLMHGSGGSRERVARHVRMLARHGYGVLALDNPGNGESEGHANGLGDNAQPAVDAALDWLSRRPDVDPDRIAGFGSSLGAEVLLRGRGARAAAARRRGRRRDPPARRPRGDRPLARRADRSRARPPGGPGRLGHGGVAVARWASCRASRPARCC